MALNLIRYDGKHTKPWPAAERALPPMSFFCQLSFYLS